MDEKTLYEDSQLRITFLQDSEGNTSSGKDHELHIIPSESRYILQRGILEEIATESRDKLPNLLDLINLQILYDLGKNNLTPDSVGVACCQAYIEEERRYDNYTFAQKVHVIMNG